MKKTVITNNQFTILIVLFNISSSTLILPPLIALEANRDAWLSSLGAMGIGLLIAMLYGALVKRESEKTLAENCERILGRWVGKTVFLLFLLYYFILTAVLLRILGDFITTLIMPETPIQAIEIAFFAVVTVGVRLGLEVVARTSETVMPWVLLFLLTLMAALVPEYRWSNLAPFMENGIQPVVRGILPILGIQYLDMVIFLMMAPSMMHPSKAGRLFMKGVWVGGLILTIHTFLSILVLGADFTSRLHYPIYELAQKITIGRFIQRIEVVAGGMVFISLFVKITICFYATVTGLSQFLGLKQYKPLTLPLGMMVIVFSLILSPNIAFFQKFALETWTPLCLIFGLILPLVLFFADKVRRKKKPQLQTGE